MAKAINWPREFREEILAEDTEAERCAFRLGDLYYENRYWVPDEVVDVRVNHLKVRKAVIVGDLQQYPAGQLPPEILQKQKSTLRSIPAVLDYLSRTYNQPVDAQTPVTVVTYKNQPLIPEEMETQDDPHM